jgi:hypothetical protein
LGASDDEYAFLEDAVLSALTNEGTDAAVEAALRNGLTYMADEGYSQRLAERESDPVALGLIVPVIRSWWSRSPAPPRTTA